MSSLSRDDLSIGDRLDDHICGPTSRTTLALFAGGSGDHNPIHIDIDFAKNAGFDDVFSHGMLSMAYLAQILTPWSSVFALRSFHVRFKALTPVNSIVRCSAEVIEVFEIAGERCAKMRLMTSLEDGRQTISGEVVVAVS